MTEEKDMIQEELDASEEVSSMLSALTKDGAERLVPAERDWDRIEQKLLARIDAEIEADAPSEALAAITRESKTHLVPVDPNWSSIERKVLRRLGQRPIALPVQWRGVVAVGAIAAAAAAMIFAGRSQQSWFDSSTQARSAGVLGAHEGSVRIAGSPAMAGQAAQVGDRVEVDTGRAVFEQKAFEQKASDQTGAVTWSLESKSRVRITRTEGGLVLALEQGATEAQVVPVASGEAFAVDVSDSSGHVARVAVHGTHLRVARTGDHVVIDLTEGVVTIGRAPRAGSTYGTLVTAPAHVELDVSDVEAVRVDHTPTAVRTAAVLAFADKPQPTTQPVAWTTLPPVDLVGEPRPAHVPVQRPDHIPEPAPAALDAIQKVEAAVQACFMQGASQLPQGSPEVHISVSTDLSLPVERDGVVHTFTFSTALSKSEQECVGKTVWATRFPEADKTVQLHFDLSR
jgi:hypothetical protein